LGFAFIFCLSLSQAVLANSYEDSESFEIIVDQAGYYHISVRYVAIPGGGDITREIRVNGEVALGAEVITFRRFFVDATTDWQYQQGNQLFPTQVEVERPVDFVLEARPALPIAIWLEAGRNTIEFMELEGYMTILEPPTAVPAMPRLTYAQYRQLHSGVPRASGEMIVIQAQHAAYKTSRTLIPQNDRTCPLVTPYHHTYITLNTIGGEAWRAAGQLIEWSVYVPQTGMYRIAIRYAQRENTGFSSRVLTINGEVPFDEAAYLRFERRNSFNSRYLACFDTGEYFWFFLEAGYNMIGLEATLGVFENIVADATAALRAFTNIYRDIVRITSAVPDRNRDYNILLYIPDFRQRLRAESEFLEQILAEMEAVGAQFTETTAILERLIFNATRLADRPYMVAYWLSAFQVSIAALSNFVVQAQDQPLLIDVIGLGGEEAELFRARANIFQIFWHNLRAFIGSFFNDFTVQLDTVDAEDQITVEVWISSGFDMFSNLGRLINEQFVTSHPHINIDLKLVDASIVFPASLTGRGPDVVLQGSAMMPINFAHRGGAIDLTQFADFEEVAMRFAPAAVDTFRFMDGVYALPDQMHFDVMFYRSDILEELGLEVPNTMEELLAMVPLLQSQFMDVFFTRAPQPTPGSEGGVGATTRGVNTVHTNILHQRGGSIFGSGGAYTNVATPIGLEAFDFWTELYTNHGFLLVADALTRFRIGNMPIIVADVGMFNTLTATAPEIRGNWGIAPIPGHYRPCGEFRRDGLISVSSNFIVGNTVERRGTADAAWEFLKWFTSAPVQERFAVDAEVVWGHNWRYQTANMEAFSSLAWGRNVWPTLEESLAWTFAMPQVPGGYIVGRELHNAFNQAVVDGRNPSHALFDARDAINRELTLKRREFGIYE